MRNREKVYKLEKYLVFIAKILRWIFPVKFRYGLLNFNRRNTSKLAIAINCILVKSLAKRCGANVAIFSGVYLYNLENIVIGNNVSIHPMTYIEGYGGIEIGDDVSIAHNVSILSTEHVYKDININIKDQGCLNKSVLICSNVWIGCGARILAGSKIKEGVIVAAGAVVKGSIEQNNIVGGVPCKTLKVRRKDEDCICT